ncbi:MAG TPA: vitamin B12 dependent-methionine synthase activation domain-containing protein, partial [Candidatus Dormibacteraeota bacterium]|nr:vitamin B12 dependent-methionine synthase activation domain-containing protein [Candidatus Dormibacteraeota bacterium]
SGLITPSLDEMVHVAKEMERTGLKLPLLIGGATTSKAHTAVKIAPGYSEPVVHVLDASRAVPVVSNLISREQKTAFARQVRDEYDRLRTQHAAAAAKLRTLQEARARAPRFDWPTIDLPQPDFTGVRTLEDFPLAELVPFIDWSPFFHTWELRGRYPAIFEHPKYGEEARKLFADAQHLLDQIVSGKKLRACAAYGFFPANSVGDDVEVFRDGARRDVLARFHFLRQQAEKPDGSPHYCLADFVAPRPAPGEPGPAAADHLGGFAVTSGHGLTELVTQFKRDHDDYNAIMAEALADRLAEAFAECLHQRVRVQWGYGRAENLTQEQIIDEQYRGIRPAAGYPACPDHTEKWTLWSLLQAEERAGIKLTESCAMWPG